MIDNYYPRRHKLSRASTNIVSRKTSGPGILLSFVRALLLGGATLTTGLVAGVFYAYSVSVDPGLAVQSDASYVATMQEINARIQNPLFFASFFGAVLFPLAALVVHLPGLRSGRFLLISLASLLYIGGGFLLTAFVNVPMNDQLATVDPGAPARVLSQAREVYEGPWDFWNGVRTVFSTLSFVALVGACLLTPGRRKHSAL
jgi:uncharacterized membrane protein